MLTNRYSTCFVNLHLGYTLERSVGVAQVCCLKLCLARTTSYTRSTRRPWSFQPDASWPHPPVHHQHPAWFPGHEPCGSPTHLNPVEKTTGMSETDKGETSERAQCLRSRACADQQSQCHLHGWAGPDWWDRSHLFQCFRGSCQFNSLLSSRWDISAWVAGAFLFVSSTTMVCKMRSFRCSTRCNDYVKLLN